jgi:hypothetical protein
MGSLRISPGYARNLPVKAPGHDRCITGEFENGKGTGRREPWSEGGAHADRSDPVGTHANSGHADHLGWRPWNSGGGRGPRESSSSYDVPIDINYNFIGSGYLVGKFVPSASNCVTGHNFDYQMKVTYERPEDHRYGTRKTNIIPATRFAVDTSWNCLGK